MICPNCNANLQKENGQGDPLLRVKGIIMRKSSVIGICPKCSGDVPLPQTIMHELHKSIVLFFQKS